LQLEKFFKNTIEDFDEQTGFRKLCKLFFGSLNTKLSYRNLELNKISSFHIKTLKKAMKEKKMF